MSEGITAEVEEPRSANAVAREQEEAKLGMEPKKKDVNTDSPYSALQLATGNLSRESKSGFEEQPIAKTANPAPQTQTTNGELMDGIELVQNGAKENGDVVLTNRVGSAPSSLRDTTTETEPKPDDQYMPEPAHKVMNKRGYDPDKCIVCQEDLGKYKCPRCQLKYCSVACNKLHKSTHNDEHEPTRPTQPKYHPADDVSEEKVGLQGRKLDHPYKTLEQSEELKWLFQKYPRLPNLLLEIHASTQPPPSKKSRIPESLMKGLPAEANQNTWGKDKAIHEGKSKLRAMRITKDNDGEAVREYCLLVSSLLNEAYDR